MYLLILQFCVQVSLKYNSSAGMMPCRKLLPCSPWVPHTSGAPATSGPHIIMFGFSSCLHSGWRPSGQGQCVARCPVEDCCIAALGCLTPQSLLSPNSITLHDSDIPMYSLWPWEGLCHRGITATRCCFVLRSNH